VRFLLSKMQQVHFWSSAAFVAHALGRAAWKLISTPAWRLRWTPEIARLWLLACGIPSSRLSGAGLGRIEELRTRLWRERPYGL
jgi:hypothetical protein